MPEANQLLTAGIVGPLLFVVVFMVDGATRPGYRPTYHLVSALALGPRGRVQTTNFVLCGILVVVAAVGIEEATSSIWLSGMLGAFGLGLVASGVFPMDRSVAIHPVRRRGRLSSVGLIVSTTWPVSSCSAPCRWQQESRPSRSTPLPGPFSQA